MERLYGLHTDFWSDGVLSFEISTLGAVANPLDFKEVLLSRTGDIHPQPGIYKIEAPPTHPEFTAMTPRFFNKLFKRKKKGPEEPIFKLSECSPNAIGIWASTCEINGDIFNRWKLPIQPEQRPRSSRAQQKSSQQQSPLFHLPAEIRRLIYLELMGDRRVHVRYFWRQPSPEPQSEPRWRWWHAVCNHSDGFIDDPGEDTCSTWSREVYMHNPRPKIGCMEWLRCCQIG